MKLIRFLLFPVALVYDLVTRIRNILFDRGVFETTSFDIPVIAVGNLSVGGTGKTPQIEYLIRLLQKDYKVAVLSRGYKRKTKGFIQLNNSHSAEDVGDEPLQFFKKFLNITVAVDANRVNGIKNLIKSVNPDVILLDDAYQHRKVKAGFYILLTKFSDLYADDFLLPTGSLREARKGSKRANVILVTKCPKTLTKEGQQEIVKKLNVKCCQKVFFTSISYNETLYGKEKIDLDDLKEKKVYLITGIANPKPLLNYLSSKNIELTHLSYPDHYNFTDSDIENIKRKFDEDLSENKILLTTEKDYMRLSNRIGDLNYIAIETVFLDKKHSFETSIQQFVSE